MMKAERSESSVSPEVLEAYSVESRHRTLVLARMLAAIGLVAIALFWAQDVRIVGTRDFIPWRTLGMVPLAAFLVLSFRVFRKAPGLILPFHAVSLAALMAMMCGIAVSVALHSDSDHTQLHAAANGITVVIFAVFIFSSGARKFLWAILLIPLAATAAALLPARSLTGMDWSCFSNPALLAIVVVIYASWQERERLKDFALKSKAEANDRLVHLHHNMMSAMLDAVGESAFLMRPDGVIAYANSTVARRLGSDKVSIIGKNAFQLLPQDVSERRRGMVGQCLMTGEPVHFTDERLGRIIDNIIFPVRDAGNAIAYLAVFGLDSTERVKAEAEVARLLTGKTLLLKEVHHRIKNNMGTIASLLALSADNARIPEAATVLEEMRGRVMAMMGIYDRLYRSEDYSSVGLRAYVQDLIAEIESTCRTNDSVRITAEVDDLEAPPSRTFAVGIIVNELVTNALKYAFPEQRRGTVAVRVRGAEGGGIVLEVSDDGIGQGAKQPQGRKEGFGLQLVRLMVEQCGGTLSMEAEVGTSVEIVLPKG